MVLSLYNARLDGPEAAPQRARLLEGVRSEIERLPGVERVALASGPPWSDRRRLGVSLDAAAPETTWVQAFEQAVDERWREVVGLSLRSGDSLPGSAETARDEPEAAAASPGAAETQDREDLGQIWISARLARALDLGADPVGARLYLHPPSGEDIRARGEEAVGPPVRVAGVVADLDLPGDERALRLYRPMRSGDHAAQLLVRTAGADLLPRNTLDDVLARVAPGVGIVDVQPAGEGLAAPTCAVRGVAETLTLFAVIALLVACSGVFAVLSLAAQQRKKEIALRSALGATRRQITNLIQREAWLQILLAVPVAFVVLRIASVPVAELLGEAAPPWWIVASGGAVVVLVVLAAARRPARVAAGVDVAGVLGEE